MSPTDREHDRLLNDPYASQYVRWYDREGNRISMSEANTLLADREAREVGWDQVGPYVVSTVFLCLDHSHMPSDEPVLYETMVFAADEWHDEESQGLSEFDMVRYHTEAEAEQGHADMVTLMRATTQEEP